MRRIVSVMVLSLLLVGTFALAFNVGLVRAQAETIYINSDGSVSPSDAPISSVDNVTYTFTGNMIYPAYDGIVVERNNTVIDGNGYTLQGSYSNSGTGLSLIDVNNVTVENANVEGFTYGISLVDSSNNTVSANSATANNITGIGLYSSSNDSVNENNVTNNSLGILLSSSLNNTVNGNNITANSYDGILLTSSSNNNTVSGNNVTANNEEGIEIDYSSGNVLSDNVIEDNRYNFGVSGSVLGDFMNSVDTSNLVDGKPVYYITSESNLVISPENYPDIGYLAVVNCTNMTVQGLTLTNEGEGILLAFTDDSKITNNNATNDDEGIYLYSSSNNTLSENNATANYSGFWLDFSSNNTVSGNDMTANSYCGIYLYFNSSNNAIYHNNFVGNAAQAYVDTTSVGNVWDNGYPSGGNYWSNYNGADFYSGPYQNVTGSDGLGDVLYVVQYEDFHDIDHFPLMGPFSDFSVAAGVDVQVVSNSTVSDFQFNGTAILFNVSGVNSTTGFCTMAVPSSLLNGTFTVFVNGTQVQYSLLPSSNSTISYLYFTYGHSTEQVIVMPEFPEPLIMAMFMLATLFAIAIYEKRYSRSIHC